MNFKNFTYFKLFISVMAFGLPTLGWADQVLEDRVTKLETLLNNKLNLEQLNQVAELQEEVRALRGKIEEQEHEIKLLNKKQLDAQMAASAASSTSPVSKANGANANATNSTTSQNTIYKQSAVPTNTSVDYSLTKTAKATQADELAYNQAYALIKLKEYDAAINLFAEFLQRYPESKLVPNAHYWLGEAYLIKWRDDRTNEAALENALNDFNIIVNNFSTHSKAQDALLKIGIIEVSRGNLLAAKDYFERIKKEYPDSTAANLADAQLKKLRTTGNI